MRLFKKWLNKSPPCPPATSPPPALPADLLAVDSTGFANLDIPTAGKTGTAEYCDEHAAANNLCEPGRWPSHAWTVAYAPYENPEVAVIAFAYNGGEGAPVAGPIVRRVLEAYFEIKSIDSALGNP